MSTPVMPQEWMEAYGSSGYPEGVELLRKHIEMKQKSRILIKGGEVKWDRRHPQSPCAPLIDTRLGFGNSFCNVGLSEIAPRGHTGKHKHGEACIYIIEGRGYTIVEGKRYDWEAGDGLYVPPNAYHQHFNSDPHKPVKYLRVIPGPLYLNLLSLLAALNIAPKPQIEYVETAEGSTEEARLTQEGRTTLRE